MKEQLQDGRIPKDQVFNTQRNSIGPITPRFMLGPPSKDVGNPVPIPIHPPDRGIRVAI
jgi:hypothetical protein